MDGGKLHNGIESIDHPVIAARDGFPQLGNIDWEWAGVAILRRPGVALSVIANRIMDVAERRLGRR